MQIAIQVWIVLFQTACCMTCIGCGAKRAKFNNGKINKEMCRILTDFQDIKDMEITDIYFFKVKQHKVSADGWRKQSKGTRLFSEKLLREVCNSVTKTKCWRSQKSRGHLVFNADDLIICYENSQSSFSLCTPSQTLHKTKLYSNFIVSSRAIRKQTASTVWCAHYWIFKRQILLF